MDFCITAKRVSDERAPKSEFWWEAPDGSRILTTKLGKGGRSYLFEFGITGIRRGRTNDQHMHYRWNEGGLIYHKANLGEEGIDHFVYDDNTTFYPDQIGKNFNDAWDSTDNSVSENVRLLLLGCDFSGACPDIERFIKEAEKQITDKEIKLSTLQEYIDALKEDIDINSLNTVCGELRDGPSAACSGNALATRLYIKQKNKKVENMTEMFENCFSLTSLDLGSFNTSQVKNMSKMFNGIGLTSIDLSSFDTSKVLSMNQMFSEMLNLNYINISYFNTQNVKDMNKMFYKCENLREIDIRFFDVRNIEDLSYMFSGCKSLICLDISNYNATNLISMDNIFEECLSLKSLYLKNFNAGKVRSLKYVFPKVQNNNIEFINMTNFQAYNLEKIDALFYDFRNLSILDFSNFKAPLVKSAS